MHVGLGRGIRPVSLRGDRGGIIVPSSSIERVEEFAPHRAALSTAVFVHRLDLRLSVRCGKIATTYLFERGVGELQNVHDPNKPSVGLDNR